MGESCVQTLLIDNHDSYTYNLYQYLSVINNTPPIVLPNDFCQGSWNKTELYLKKNNIHYDNIVISPGPGCPTLQKDFGICREAILTSDKPILGVCLGMQGIGAAFGATIQRAPVPMHGRLSTLNSIDKNCPLMKEVKENTPVVRYHSLCVENLPEDLMPTSFCLSEEENSTYDILFSSFQSNQNLNDLLSPPNPNTQVDPLVLSTNKTKILMSLRHRIRPIFGIQYHPESIGTVCGKVILSNFRIITESCSPRVPRFNFHTSSSDSSPHSPQATSSLKKWISKTLGHYNPFILHIESLQLHSPSLPNILSLLYRTKDPANGICLLDSAQGVSTLALEEGPFSFSLDAVDDERVIFRLPSSSVAPLTAPLSELAEAVSFITRAFSICETKHEIVSSESFKGGLCGFFSYEYYQHSMEHRKQVLSKKASRFLWESALVSPFPDDLKLHSKKKREGEPLALWIFSSRFLLYDHKSRKVHICCLLKEGFINENTLQHQWLSQMKHDISNSSLCISGDPVLCNFVSGESSMPVFQGTVKQDEYIRHVDEIKVLISRGETYETCYTNHRVYTRESKSEINRCDLYEVLRQHNPVPHGAFLEYDPSLRFSSSSSTAPDSSQSYMKSISSSCNGQAMSDSDEYLASNLSEGMCKDAYSSSSISICSFSPERFVRLSGEGKVETKPIKGTRKRDGDKKKDQELTESLKRSNKECSENLMIVDLLRNDLGIISLPGSVKVDKIFDIETHNHVLQMVSTIKSDLDVDTYDPMDLISALFPGGSMTGAPKLRTMSFINSLEKNRRGVYSGSLGFISLKMQGEKCSSLDMNIVIRTLVITPSLYSIGTGGAVIHLSDSMDEYKEMLLKSSNIERIFITYMQKHLDSAKVVCMSNTAETSDMTNIQKLMEDSSII